MVDRFSQTHFSTNSVFHNPGYLHDQVSHRFLRPFLLLRTIDGDFGHVVTAQSVTRHGFGPITEDYFECLTSLQR